MSEKEYGQEERGSDVISLTAGEKTARPLFALLRERGIEIDQPCGGNGTCGNCRVKFLEGAPEITPEDRRWFSGEELEDGWRLACRARVRGNCRVMVPKERGKQIVSAVDFRKPKTEKEETDRKERRNPARQNGGYGLAVDIGTTTLAAALIALPEGKQLAAATCVNSQRVYGADVLSRILQANGGALADMREIVRL